LLTVRLNKNASVLATSNVAPQVTVIAAASPASRPVVFSVFAPVTVNVGEALSESDVELKAWVSTDAGQRVTGPAQVEDDPGIVNVGFAVAHARRKGDGPRSEVLGVHTRAGRVAGEPAGLPSGSELQSEGSLKFPAPPIQATPCAMILSSRIFTTSRLEPSRRDPHPAPRISVRGSRHLLPEGEGIISQRDRCSPYRNRSSRDPRSC
jgi:hypothetical protein